MQIKVTNYPTVSTDIKVTVKGPLSLWSSELRLYVIRVGILLFTNDLREIILSYRGTSLEVLRLRLGVRKVDQSQGDSWVRGLKFYLYVICIMAERRQLNLRGTSLNGSGYMVKQYCHRVNYSVLKGSFVTGY